MLEDATAVLGDLVAQPTVSADSNLELIAYCAAKLDALGAKTEMTLDPSGTKANLFATIGPEEDGGIVLSGHTDVVPVDGQEWSVEPFALTRRDGRLYGRGACDMKGFIACALAMAPRFAEADLARPLHLALTYDEEVGCMGAKVLLQALKASGRRPAICLIGEPTEMRIIEGHKGCYEYSVAFKGLAGHGSDPDAGVSAVEYAVRYVARLLELREALKARAIAGSPFRPPFSTLQVGRMAGGIAQNVIADHCQVDWEFRPVAPADVVFLKSAIAAYAEDTLLPAMRAVHPDAAIETTVLGEVDGLEPMADSEAVRLAAALTGGNATDVVSFGTEAGLYQALGMSTVVCGPGSIEQAHKADEFIAEDQLAQCLGMLERLARRLEGAA
ncbi:MAG: acetylornithine deacetylase [Rhodospirillaceae bacterium]|nr:acetylornithine deacetylase [Rhodospirillaceae bacterium]